MHAVTPSASLLLPSLPLLALSTAPLKKCKGGYAGNFGSALAFAAKAYQNSAQKLGEMVRDPGAGLRKFSESTLTQSWDRCLPFYGVLVSRADNPSNGFVFRSVNCSGDCSFGTHCSSCASQIVRQEIKFSVESDVQQCAAKSTTIKNIATNPVLTATKICMLRKEVMCLRCQLARKVLSTEIDKHGHPFAGG